MTDLIIRSLIIASIIFLIGYIIAQITGPISIRVIRVNDYDFYDYEDDDYEDEEEEEIRKIVHRTVVLANIDSYEIFKMTSDHEAMVRIVYLEARGEPLAGKIEVAKVIFNRTHNEAFPNTIKEVILQPRQFSPAHLIETVEIADEDRKEVERAILRAYHQICVEMLEDNDNKALYFVNPTIAHQPSYEWMQKTLRYVKTIGQHEFYQ